MSKTVSSRPYSIALAGVRKFQDAIGRTDEGAAVQLLHEADNPYDERAIVAVNAASETLGYVPRDGWAQEALIDDAKGVKARVSSKGMADGGLIGMTLRVQLIDGAPIGTRAFVVS